MTKTNSFLFVFVVCCKPGSNNPSLLDELRLKLNHSSYQGKSNSIKRRRLKTKINILEGFKTSEEAKKIRNEKRKENKKKRKQNSLEHQKTRVAAKKKGNNKKVEAKKEENEEEVGKKGKVRKQAKYNRWMNKKGKVNFDRQEKRHAGRIPKVEKEAKQDDASTGTSSAAASKKDPGLANRLGSKDPGRGIPRQVVEEKKKEVKEESGGIFSWIFGKK